MIVGRTIPRIVIHLDSDEFLVLDDDKIKYYDSSESYCRSGYYVSVTWHDLAFIINTLNKDGIIDFDDETIGKVLDDGVELDHPPDDWSDEDKDEDGNPVPIEYRGPEYIVELSRLDNCDQLLEEESKENVTDGIDSRKGSDRSPKKKSKKNK